MSWTRATDDSSVSSACCSTIGSEGDFKHGLIAAVKRALGFFSLIRHCLCLALSQRQCITTPDRQIALAHSWWVTLQFPVTIGSLWLLCSSCLYYAELFIIDVLTFDRFPLIITQRVETTKLLQSHKKENSHSLTVERKCYHWAWLNRSFVFRQSGIKCCKAQSDDIYCQLQTPHVKHCLFVLKQLLAS